MPRRAGSAGPQAAAAAAAPAPPPAPHFPPPFPFRTMRSARALLLALALRVYALDTETPAGENGAGVPEGGGGSDCWRRARGALPAVGHGGVPPLPGRSGSRLSRSRRSLRGGRRVRDSRGRSSAARGWSARPRLSPPPSAGGLRWLPGSGGHLRPSSVLPSPLHPRPGELSPAGGGA